MGTVVAVLVIAVVGAAAFGMKAMWFTFMAEVWRKPPQLRQTPRGSAHARRTENVDVAR
jgi:hypothetical protein